jgi:thiamine biosynthesis lipoprotein
LTGRRSVTVVAPRGIMADSLTKVASVLEPARGLAVVESFPGASALVVCRTGKGLETFASRSFPKAEADGR